MSPPAKMLQPERLGTPLTVAGVHLIADISGAAYEPVSETLLVADLHFEKGSFFARRGQLLPPYDTRATLSKLASAIERLRPRCVMALGDSFHDLDADGRMHEGDAQTLAGLVRSIEDWVWIEGNHDPAPPQRFGGRTTAEERLEGLTLRHEPHPGAFDGEIAGHLHPCAKIRTRARGLRRRCFASDGRRLVLPSFGAYTGGLNVCDPAWAKIFPDGPTAWMVGDQRVVPVSRAKLLPD